MWRECDCLRTYVPAYHTHVGTAVAAWVKHPAGQKKKALNSFAESRLFLGTPGAIRTHGLQSRSLTLYPTELRAHEQLSLRQKCITIRKQCQAFGSTSVDRSGCLLNCGHAGSFGGIRHMPDSASFRSTRRSCVPLHMASSYPIIHAPSGCLI